MSLFKSNFWENITYFIEETSRFEKLPFFTSAPEMQEKVLFDVY
jgi:hypothetical protein